jgi:AcrR family transcriptional regulator
MPRPSQNVDQALLDAGMALLPRHGCKALSVRQVAEHAGVNLGMFHYHFRTKDAFIRAVLQRMYESMFARLALQLRPGASPLANLAAVLRLLARFAREHAALLARLLADAAGGERVAIEFLQANLPRHAAVVARLLREAQAQGLVVRAPLPRLLAFVAGSVGAPTLLGGAAARLGKPELAALLAQHVLSDRAIAQRVQFALRGIATAKGAPR